MIVIDSSAWIDFLRARGTGAHLTVRRLLYEDVELAATEVVMMEVLAGARTHREERMIRGQLSAFPVLSLRGLADFEAAADLYRACRDAGEPIRHLTDCLIAVPAINAGAAVLASDSDFETLARHSPLRLEPLDE